MNSAFTPGPTPNTARAANGEVLTVPAGWILLPPGDAALTRRVKEAGDHFVVQEKRGQKVFAQGVWAPAATIERIRAGLEAERSTEGHTNKKEADARRREQAQAEYVEDFHGAVLKFLAFHPNHADLADRLARAVTDHATPVGSGTVARTKRIPIERRAKAAVIAWMRHETTKAIRDLLRIRQFDFRWMLRRRIEESSMAWMVQIGGFIVDARRLKREVQEEAFRKGLIPYVPGEQPQGGEAPPE
jgi:hypothetical protein